MFGPYILSRRTGRNAMLELKVQALRQTAHAWRHRREKTRNKNPDRDTNRVGAARVVAKAMDGARSFRGACRIGRFDGNTTA
jgi:hypothetical protein